MQVKNFGKQGRTKYTHLTDQDTTKWDSPWANPTDPLRLKYNKRVLVSMDILIDLLYHSRWQELNP